MPVISNEFHTHLRGRRSALSNMRTRAWHHWCELANYILPRRYIWLMTREEFRDKGLSRSQYILDSTGTLSARVLANGMMSGITSPSRRWFRLRIPDFEAPKGSTAARWLEDVTSVILRIMAESNFYQAMQIMYLDLGVFGTAAILIYEDENNVIRCYNPALGEFYVGQGPDQIVNVLYREYHLKVHQVVEQFGIKNVSEAVKAQWNIQGTGLQEDIRICHAIEPRNALSPIPRNFQFQEVFWDLGAPDGQALAVRGLHEFNAIVPRWETTGNDPYGNSPGMDALPDIIQLQHETKRKGQGLDELVRPSMLADVSLKNKPKATLPGGITYIHNLANNPGMRPAKQIQIPIAELTQDIQQIQGRIQNTFHNDLFRQISQLETVRSATEIDALRQEQLLRLGPVLERFENEALDPAIERIYAIALRQGLIPEPPAELEGANVEIQYVSIMADAQRATATASLERLMAFGGETAAAFPDVLDNIDSDMVMRSYADFINAPSSALRDLSERDEVRQGRQDQLQAQQEAQVGSVAVDAAKSLSETEVGGGLNALQAITGGGV